MAENDKLAKKLDKEYGGDMSQDMHINHFYVIFRNKTDDFDEDKSLQKILDPYAFDNLETEWPEFVIIRYPLVASETEREREERLNVKLRKPLQELISQQYKISRPKIIISRICKYTKAADDTPTYSGSAIVEESLDRIYGPSSIDARNKHIEHFYFFIRFNSVDAQAIEEPDVPGEMAKQPGEGEQVSPQAIKVLDVPGEMAKLGKWKLVSSQEDFLLQIYFGYFLKASPFETERVRELRLNSEVRDKLKGDITAKLQQGDRVKVSVIFTRACKYTDM